MDASASGNSEDITDSDTIINYNLLVAFEDDVKVQPPITIVDGTFFELISSNDKKLTASCVLCKPKVLTISGHGNTSTNFLKHLRSKHGTKAVENYQSYLKEKKRLKKRKTEQSQSINSNNSDYNLPKEEAVEEATASSLNNSSIVNSVELTVKFIIDSMVPLRTVENKYFKQLCHRADNVTFSRRTLSRKIIDYFRSNQTVIREISKDVPYVCTTCDIWSTKKRSFLGVTMHWITEDFHRKSVALACRRFSNRRNAEQIANLLGEIYSQYEIENKVVATVTDSASSFAKAFRLYRIKPTNILADSNNIVEENTFANESSFEEVDTNETTEFYRLLPWHIKCASHTLNLCITTDLERFIKSSAELSDIHYSAIKKCNRLWAYDGKQKMAKTIKNILGHALSRPGKTQWNLLYNSLQQIISIENNLPQLESALDIEEPLTEQELQYIKEYLMSTRPIADVLDILQGNDIFYGILLPSILSCDRKLNNLCQQSWVYCSSLVAALRTNVRKRFSDFFHFSNIDTFHTAVAAFSHPRFKRRWLHVVDSIHHTKLLAKFKDAVSSFAKVAVQNTECNVAGEDFFDFGIESEFDNAYVTNELNAELEITQYFYDPSQDLKSLRKYPLICQVFNKFNTPLPSSAPVEHMFSYATMTSLLKLNGLSDELWEERVVLKSNMQLLEENLIPKK